MSMPDCEMCGQGPHYLAGEYMGCLDNFKAEQAAEKNLDRWAQDWDNDPAVKRVREDIEDAR